MAPSTAAAAAGSPRPRPRHRARARVKSSEALTALPSSRKPRASKTSVTAETCGPTGARSVHRLGAPSRRRLSSGRARRSLDNACRGSKGTTDRPCRALAVALIIARH